MTEQTIHTTVTQTRVKTKVENPTTTVTTQAIPVDITSPQADLVTQVVYAGRPGKDGQDGAPGAPGTGGGSYVHTQGTASAVWTIVHNLSFQPNVTVVDSAGTTVEGEVDYIDGSTVQVTFSAAFGGLAYLS